MWIGADRIPALSGACLGRIPSRSNGSNNSPHFLLFSTIWGICFSLKANPNSSNAGSFDTVLTRSDAPTVKRFLGRDRTLNLAAPGDAEPGMHWRLAVKWS